MYYPIVGERVLVDGCPFGFVVVRIDHAAHLATLAAASGKHAFDTRNLGASDGHALRENVPLGYPLALRKFEGKHERINHSLGYYVRGDIGEVHTNTVESAFSLFKRGLNGSFHKVSIKHLHRYLSEFEFRFNERKNKQRFEKLVSRTAQASPLMYQELVAWDVDPEEVPF